MEDIIYNKILGQCLWTLCLKTMRGTWYWDGFHVSHNDPAITIICYQWHRQYKLVMKIRTGIRTTFQMIHIVSSYQLRQDGVQLIKGKIIYAVYGDHRGRTEHALVFFYFPANGQTNPDVFQPKTFCIPRGIIPQNFSSLGFAVSEELGNIQTHTHTNSLTDRLVL